MTTELMKNMILTLLELVVIVELVVIMKIVNLAAGLTELAATLVGLVVVVPKLVAGFTEKREEDDKENIVGTAVLQGSTAHRTGD